MARNTNVGRCGLVSAYGLSDRALVQSRTIAASAAQSSHGQCPLATISVALGPLKEPGYMALKTFAQWWILLASASGCAISGGSRLLGFASVAINHSFGTWCGAGLLEHK